MAALSQNAHANPPTVYLIDASIYIFQAHFSPYIQYADRKGNDLSALYGFIQFLLQFKRRTRASHIAVAHDESLFCGFRHSLCPNYKSNRELPDENLAKQLAACMEICKILGFAAFGSKTYEADDIVGTIATRVRAENGQDTGISIVSRDKDLAQLLVNPEDCVWDYSGNRKRYWQNVVDDFGVTPAQIPDLLGLTGDAVDCITGVPGVGPVKARELLRHFGSLEGVYQNLHLVSTLGLRGAIRLQAQLDANRAVAELSKRLATIICDVKDPQEQFSTVTFESLQSTTFDAANLKSFLKEYAFHAQEQDRILASACSMLEQ